MIVVDLGLLASVGMRSLVHDTAQPLRRRGRHGQPAGIDMPQLVVRLLRK